jgi:HEAT repeats
MTNRDQHVRQADSRRVGRPGRQAPAERAPGTTRAAWPWCGLLLGFVLLSDARAQEPPTTPARASSGADSETAAERPALHSVDAEVARAIDGLSSRDAEVRRDAAGRLAWIGPQAKAAVPALLACLEDAEHVVRAHTAKALWDVAQRREAIPTLVELLDATHPQARPLAAFFLGHIGPGASAALPVLHRTLETSSGVERIHLAEAIARIDADDARAVAVLVEGLHNSDAELRFVSAYALGDVAPQHTDCVVPALAAAQRDADDAVRTAATLALQAFRTPARYAGEMILFEASAATALQPQPAPQPPAPAAPAGPPAADGARPGESLCLTDDPITSLTLNIAPPTTDAEGKQLQFPTNHFVRCVDDTSVQLHVAGFSRLWMPGVFQWEATAFCHRPLYFEEPNLERLGYSHGFWQPLASAGHFFGTVPALPYLMHAQPYCECVYTLGQFRPGSCAPYLCHRPPLSLHGAAVEAAVATALILAIY